MSRLKELTVRYQKLAHAMQSGVAAMMQYDLSEVSSKHLRVGVNSALSDSGAIAQLLIEKGIITREELMEKLVESLDAEVTRYEAELKEKTGVTMTLC